MVNDSATLHRLIIFHDFLKFIYSERITKFCEIFTLLLTCTTYIEQKKGEDFVKFCGLLRKYEL